jgi:hypothetical protein
MYIALNAIYFENLINNLKFEFCILKFSIKNGFKKEKPLCND